MVESVKKRKWDQDDQSDSSPATKINKVDLDPSKAASEAAARINAMLAQKGIPLHDPVAEEKPKETTKFIKDISINDLKNRYLLIKGATHTQIKEETGADIVTRGKYYPDKSLATDKEPPLYLHVSASTQESLDKAIEKINVLIENAQLPTIVPYKDEKLQEIKKTERKFFEKVLPVDIQGTPPFNLRAKIVGPSGAYVKHINQETGCRVQLKGRGSGFFEANTGQESDEPLHVHLFCTKEEGLLAGIKLTQDLIDTVKAEAEKGGSQYQYGYNNRGGYYNNSRGGYSGYNNTHQYNYKSNTSPPPPSSAAVPSPVSINGSTHSPTPVASQTTTAATTTAEYDYEAYNNYYNSYYSQQGTQGYQQYDPNAYYNYYGYTPETTTDTSNPPPPPPSSTSPPPSSSLPPPPPPPPSA